MNATEYRGTNHIFLICTKPVLSFLAKYFLIHKSKERYNLVKRSLLIFCSLLLIQSIYAQRLTNIPWAHGESRTADLHFYLVTFSPGDNLTDWFGHTAVIVKDSSLRVARIYNYGLFSFNEGFISRFAMGRLIFYAGDASVNATLRRYKSENRSIFVQELNIPENKRLNLAQKLADSVLPENRAYLYDHYYNNCSTRLRDLFDEALDGRFHTGTDSAARFTLREETMRYTDREPLMQWVLMFLMNNTIDKPIRQWDEMFLPDELSRFVGRLYYRTDDGSRIPFVRKAYIAYDSGRTATPDHVNPFPLWPFGIGLIIALIALPLGMLSARRRIYRKIFFGYGALITLPLGILGSILFFMALFTNHVVTFHNENLLLINPLTLIVFFLSLKAVFVEAQQGQRALAGFWYAHALLSIALIILKLTPFFDQQNSMALFLLVPINLAFAGIFYLNTFGQKHAAG